MDVQEANLVGVVPDDGSGDRWSFAIHPALANTLMGWQLMMLDQIPHVVLTEAPGRWPELAAIVEALPSELIGRESSQAPRSAQGRRRYSYQWFDEELVLRPSLSGVELRPAAGTEATVLRVRFVEENIRRGEVSDCVAQDQLPRLLWERLSPVRGADRFARLVGLLNLILDTEAVELPVLPADIQVDGFLFDPQLDIEETLTALTTAFDTDSDLESTTLARDAVESCVHRETIAAVKIVPLWQAGVGVLALALSLALSERFVNRPMFYWRRPVIVCSSCGRKNRLGRKRGAYRCGSPECRQELTS